RDRLQRAAGRLAQALLSGSVNRAAERGEVRSAARRAASGRRWATAAHQERASPNRSLESSEDCFSPLTTSQDSTERRPLPGWMLCESTFLHRTRRAVAFRPQDPPGIIHAVPFSGSSRPLFGSRKESTKNQSTSSGTRNVAGVIVAT